MVSIFDKAIRIAVLGQGRWLIQLFQPSYCLGCLMDGHGWPGVTLEQFGGWLQSV